VPTTDCIEKFCRREPNQLAGGVGGGGTIQSADGVAEVNRCAGNYGAGGIGDRATHRAGVAALRPGRRQDEKNAHQDKEGKNEWNCAAFERHGVPPSIG
jgi:hypothetical protein